MKSSSCKLGRLLMSLLVPVFSFCFMFFICSSNAYAADLDTLIGQPSQTTEEPSDVVIYDESESTTTDNPFKQSEDGTSSLMDAIQQSSQITDESVEKASILAGPILAFLNLVSALLLIVLMGGIGVVTVSDLIFIGIPTLRPFMHPMYNQMVSGTAPAGGGMMPMGGGFGGYGSRYGYGGMGMAGGMAGGMQQQAQPTGVKLQLVSDEAVVAVGLAVPQPQQQVGMGMPMGMGMGMQQQPQQPIQGKSAIFAYLKKRTFFLIVFAFAAVFLTSSLLTGFGLKLFSFVRDGLMQWL